MKKIGVLFFALLFLVPTVQSQYAKAQKTKKKQFYRNSRLDEPLFRWVTGDYLRHGVQFSLGPTYTFTPLNERKDIFEDEKYPYITHHAYRETKSRIGVFGELGMTHIVKRPKKIVHYIDWGLGFKYYGGKELTQVDSYSNDILVGTRNGDADFYNGYVYARTDLHNVFQMNPYLFLDNSLGINVDYALLPGNKNYNGAFISQDQKFQGDLMIQLHYSLGLGIKPWTDKGFFFVPSIEIPVFGGYEWSGGTPQIHWFSSKYYPAQLRLKFVLLFKKGPNWCPPVETNEMERQRASEYENR